jgi:hypothetical protein
MLLATLTHCAGKQTWQEVQAPEVYVELLPKAAQLEVDGKAVGAGTNSIPIPDTKRRYRFRATAPGYSPVEVELEGASLAGARLGLALPPQGYGTARTIDFDDPKGLARASQLTLEAGRAEDAVDYARRAIAVQRDAAPPYRALGSALLKLGRHREAADAFTTYLTLAPTAPDAKAIRSMVEKARGDLTMPAEKK